MGYGNFVFFLVCEQKKILSDLALMGHDNFMEFFPNNFFFIFSMFLLSFFIFIFTIFWLAAMSHHKHHQMSLIVYRLMVSAAAKPSNQKNRKFYAKAAKDWKD